MFSANFDTFSSEIYNKEVAVVGIGVSNIPLIKFLVKHGARVTACDKKTANELGITYEELKQLGVKFALGENYLKDIQKPYIFKTPGMRADTPELIEAQKNGSIISSEMDLFIKLCPSQTIGITGSDGKTTTSTLIYQMLSSQGYKCWLGGNIGIPLIGYLEQMTEQDKVILELSSFQLQKITNSPHIAVITNVEPNHLDIHTSMEEYIQAKKNIYNFQNKHGHLVLNLDNKTTAACADEAKGAVTFFTRKQILNRGVYLKNDIIHATDKDDDIDILPISDILLPGVHNVENYMAAIAAVWKMCTPEKIRQVAKSFTGVPHRIEFVKKIRDVKYYNDSIASSPTRTGACLNSFEQKVILIAGGYDKKIPFTELGENIVKKVKILLLIGKTAPKIMQAVKTAANFEHSGIVIINCSDLACAVKTANQMAKDGDVVLLSPSCASFDMFKNFEERGNHFKRLVEELR